MRWVERNIITRDVYDCYVYGWEIILLTLVEISNILIIGICTNSLYNAIIFLVTFVLVRKYTGGYHANTCLKCNICLATIYLLNLYVTLNYKVDVIPLIAITLLSGLIIIYRIGPIENKNKKLNDNQKKSNKKISLFLYFFSCIVSFLFIQISLHMSITIIITLIEILVLMLIAKREIHVDK